MEIQINSIKSKKLLQWRLLIKNQVYIIIFFPTGVTPIDLFMQFPLYTINKVLLKNNDHDVH